MNRVDASVDSYRVNLSIVFYSETETVTVIHVIPAGKAREIMPSAAPSLNIHGLAKMRKILRFLTPHPAP